MPVRYEVPSLSSSLSYVLLHSSRCAYHVMLGRVIERLDCRSENQALCSKLDTNVLYDHYGDVIMGTMASQINSLTIVYSTVYSGADQRKHQSSASLAFVRGIHRGPVNSPHKWPVTRKIFPFNDVIISSAICDCFLCTYLPLLNTLGSKPNDPYFASYNFKCIWKKFIFWFHWSLYLGAQLTISHYWFCFVPPVGAQGWRSISWVVATFKHVGGSFNLSMAATGDVWIIPSFRIWDYVLLVGHISCVITNCGQLQWAIPSLFSIAL